MEIAFRVQGLDRLPVVASLLDVLPDHLDVLGDEPLMRGPVTIEQLLIGNTTDDAECAIEVAYEGSCQLDEAILENPTSLDDALAPLGRAVASVLVRMGDLPFSFGPGPSRPD